MAREICKVCKRPTPQTCLCSVLPSKPIHLSRARVIILQHPNERKRKNASLPLIELCLQGKQSRTKDEKDGRDYVESIDFSLRSFVGRWLGEEIVDSVPVWRLLNDPNEPLFVFFPLDDAVSLNEALQTLEIKYHQRHYNQPAASKKSTVTIESTYKINLLFIDATWKHAKEMNDKTVKKGGWPQHAVYVKIDPSKDYDDCFFKPLRFDIRTPPSPDHLSTAECIAYTLRVIEDNGNELFDTLMRPLDLMVQQWHCLKTIKNN